MDTTTTISMRETSAEDRGEESRTQSTMNDRGLEPSQDAAVLPEDDGMRSLREQLHNIRILAMSTEERAQRMHQLMTKDYLTHMVTSDTPTQDTTSAATATKAAATTTTTTTTTATANPYHLRSRDLEPTFSPLPVSIDETAIDDEDDTEELALMLGCMHYKRNVKIQCFDCERWYTCRHCHDAAQDLPFQHNLNRKRTKNMLCMLCKTPQPAAEICCNCGEYAAWYYCPKCKLWDNDIHKRIYHCDDCGLCRIGEGLGKDFVHCKRCNVCISISTSSAHPCIERATDSDCPLCLSYLFESKTPVVSLPCGHYMHGECYKDLMAVTYKCPVCNKSAVNMELQWRKLDDEIEAQPMPEDDQDLANLLPHIEEHTPTTEDPPQRPRRPRLVWIGCNDCGGRCHTPFHWLGLKCQNCAGYNTNQMAPPAGRESETERVLRQQAQHRQHDFTGDTVLRDIGVGIVSEDDDDYDRVDSAYAMSSSPSSNPSRTLHRRSSEAHSPGRRYFVQLEEPRRSSSFTAPRFSTPRFSTPSMPNLSNLGTLPRMPDLPSLQEMALPSLPQMPNMPSIELPRFSPAEMYAVISRSLSPMRYYREGIDRRDEFIRSFSGSSWRNSAPPGSLDEREQPDRRATLRQNSLNLESGSTREDRSRNDTNEDDDIFEALVGHR